MSTRVGVNLIGCTAHGLCAEWLPERITVDEWGYPVVDPTELPDELTRLALRAAKECPTRALWLGTQPDRA